MERIVLFAVPLLLGGVLAAFATGAARAQIPVVYGYPLASRCPAAGRADDVDRWKMYDCNCTSYVAWALEANGQRTNWFIPGAMNAKNWPHVAWLARIPIGTTPRVGAVAVWPRLARPDGHVAYVTAVHNDGTFDVAEYNLGRRFGFPPYTFDRRTDIDPDASVVFIYVPNAISEPHVVLMSH